MPTLTVILALLVACSHAVTLEPLPPVSSVPPTVWTSPGLTATWWLRPAQLCLHADDARPFWDGLHWRCP